MKNAKFLVFALVLTGASVVQAKLTQDAPIVPAQLGEPVQHAPRGYWATRPQSPQNLEGLKEVMKKIPSEDGQGSRWVPSNRRVMVELMLLHADQEGCQPTS